MVTVCGAVRFAGAVYRPVAEMVPGAPELPSFESQSTETLSPVNPLGAKGIGEAGTIGVTPAVQNAVLDALRPFGVRHIDMPLNGERVWRAIEEARDDDARR